MKKVISEKELKEKMEEAICLLCDTVSDTLGPVCSNVLISNTMSSPYITNDGVTIAMNIESEDNVINTILEIAKEASLKTNEIVGDGTTTTLVLLKYIYLEGRKLIEAGKSGITLKKELQYACEQTKNALKKFSRKTKEIDYERVASISVNDKEMGHFLWDCYKKVGSKSAVRLEESKNNSTYYKIETGYKIEINALKDYYLKEEQLLLKNVHILLLQGALENLEDISEIINIGIQEKKTILIIAQYIKEEVKQQLYSILLMEQIKIYFIEVPDYASRKMDIINDLSVITNSKICDNFLQKIEWNCLGWSSSVKIEKESAIISIEKNDSLEKQKIKIKELIKSCDSDYEKEFLEERLAKFEQGICTIYVGGITTTEKRERKSRMEDGIHAIEVAKEGVILGEGIGMFLASRELKNSDGEKVLKYSLHKPLEIILKNAGLESDKIKKQIIEKEIKEVYNIEKNCYEKSSDTDILDPLKVELYALENAVSIASMLLTTNHIIINEKEKYEIEI